jgi:SAM-dependent methyltransferase
MKSELIARQSRLPSGWLGEIVARVMSLETRRANELALDRLAACEGEAILEVGCGHGRTLATLEGKGCAFLAGVDASEVMVRVARRRLRRSIGHGRAAIDLATSDALPHPDARFDAALAVHVLYFWSDPLRDLREIRRVLRPGGRLILGYRPRDATTLAALPASVYSLRSTEDVEELLTRAGFAGIRTTEMAPAPARFVCTTGVRPAVPTCAPTS